MKRLSTVFLLFLALFLPGCSIWDILGLGGSSGQVSGERIWTVMVYIAAANDMESVAKMNINQMEKVGSTANVTILVQLDTKTACYRYLIQRDNDESNINSPILGKMPHQNSGDPAVLADFIKWGVKDFPAKHYALVLWNHGSGWKPTYSRTLPRAICFDFVSNDALDTDELREAFESANIRFDFLGLDACLMQMTEVSTEVKDWTRVVCGSQEDEPWDGWPYDLFLGPLVQNPNMDAVQLGQVAVSAYQSYYKNSGLSATLSAVSTSPIPDLVRAIDNLGSKLASLYPSSSIDSVINSTQKFADDSYKDIFHFAQLISQNIPEARAEANAVLTLKSQLIIANWQTYRENAQGLSIYLPTSGYSEYEASYSSLIFGKLAPNWIVFIKKINGL